MEQDQRKKTLRIILFLASIIILFKVVRNNQEEPLQLVQLTGKTMGTVPYNIKYMSAGAVNYQSSIDSLLREFNQSLSTYVPSSEISRFNQNDTLVFETEHFKKMLFKSREVYSQLGGVFDPTIGPLVNAWGFGPDNPEPTMDSGVVDSLLTFVGFDKVYFDENYAAKPSGVYVDFSAIAKGYAIDLVAELLKSKMIENYMVEIGGEVRTKGFNNKDRIWSIGIEDPLVGKDEQEILVVVQLDGRSVATSGNYRNYYEKEGSIYAHIIDPRTGYNADNSLLSVSVFADDCTTADAYATGFMVLGLENTLGFVEKDSTLDVLVIYRGEEGNPVTAYSSGMESLIVQDYSMQ